MWPTDAAGASAGIPSCCSDGGDVVVAVVVVACLLHPVVVAVVVVERSIGADCADCGGVRQLCRPSNAGGDGDDLR